MLSKKTNLLNRSFQIPTGLFFQLASTIGTGGLCETLRVLTLILKDTDSLVGTCVLKT